MIAEWSDFAMVGMGAFAAGAWMGRKLALEAAKGLHVLESRLATLEHRKPAAEAVSNEPQATAMMRLASAIEKHAAAIDDHGAATVAAAVESNAQPSAKLEQKAN